MNTLRCGPSPSALFETGFLCCVAAGKQPQAASCFWGSPVCTAHLLGLEYRETPFIIPTFELYISSGNLNSGLHTSVTRVLQTLSHGANSQLACFSVSFSSSSSSPSFSSFFKNYFCESVSAHIPDWPIYMSLCRPSWHQTHRAPPASVSQLVWDSSHVSPWPSG